MTTPTLLDTLADATLLLEYTRRLLHTPHDATPAPTELEPTHPLAVLILLLDSVVFLRSVGTLGRRLESDRRSTRRKSTVSLHSSPRKNSNVGLGIAKEGDDGDEADVEELSMRSSNNGMRRKSVQSEGAYRNGSSEKNEEEDENDSWDDWSTYMKEMYLFPFEKPSPYEYNNGPAWISPLYVSPNVTPALPGICALDSYSSKAHEEVSECCRAAIECLSSLDFPSHPPPTLESILSLPPHVFPRLLPSSLHSTISSTLASRRRASISGSHQTPSILTFRWILTTLLAHFVGPAFGQLSDASQAGGTYAKEKSDDDGIRAYYKFMGNVDEETVVDDMDSQEGVRRALASILRRDEKMRWIFGDNFQATSRPPSSTSSSRGPSPHLSQTSPPIPANTVIITQRSESMENLVEERPSISTLGHDRNVSVSSVDSKSSTERPAITTPQHRRVYSTSSSITPLLESAEGKTTPTPNNRPIVKGHSRHSSHAGHSRSHSQALGPIANPPSPTFGNLAPAPIPLKSSPRPSPSVSTTSSLASLPLTTNTLSPKERRDLVWRSQKLNRLFGVPLEENAVQEILVRNPPNDEADQSSPEHSPDLYKLRPRGGLNDRRPSYASSHASLSSRRNSLPPSTSPVSGASGANSPSRPYLEVGSSSMVRSSSTPSDRSRSPSTVIDEELLKMFPYKGMQTAEQQREERRKKMAKLSKLLGEKVPAHLALNESPGKVSSAQMGRTGSGSRLGGMLGKFVGRRKEEVSPPTRHSFVPVQDLPMIQVDLNAVASPKETFQSGGGTGKVVEGMAKARKLEQVFGDLPPRTLYANRTSPHQRSFSDSGHSPAWSSTSAFGNGSHNRESTSTTRSIDSYRHSLASLNYISEQDPSALDDIAKVYDEEHQDRLMAHRASIASQAPPRPRLPLAATPLEDIEEPTKLETPPAVTPHESTSSELVSDGEQPLEFSDSDAEIKRMRASTFSNLSTSSSAYVFSRPSSTRVSQAGHSTSPEDERNPVPTSRRTDSIDSTMSAIGMRRALSAGGDHKQAVKRAQKLAGFFGTTRGEVWKMLLEDLEAAIIEEDDIDEEERQEVMEGVSKLREKQI